MIHDVDEALRALVRREALAAGDVDVAFDAPTKEWASKRTNPTVDVYLYDIREDMRRRSVGHVEVRDNEGRVTGRTRPPRFFRLSYLVTAWTQRPEDEHRLLSALLACFLRYDTLPVDVLPPALADLTLPALVTIAMPPAEDRAISETWSALGGELKPSLDLAVTVPLDAGRIAAAGPPVLEVPRFAFDAGDGEVEERARRVANGDLDAEAAPVRLEEEVVSGTPEQPGRVFRIRDMSRR